MADRFEEIADELYAVTPEEFIGVRDAAVRDAKRAGDRQLAKAVTALRRPTQAAWLSNLLARERGPDLDALLDLGVQLRDATATLEGAELRALLGQRRAVVSALVKDARRLAAAAGHPASDQAAWDVEATLEAALGDDELAGQVRSGRLVTALTAGGPASAGPGRVQAAPTARSRPASRTGPPSRRTASAERARTSVRKSDAESRDQLAARRAEHEREERRRAAAAEVERAAAASAAATEALEHAEEQAAEAEQALADARLAVADAERAAQEAEAAAGAARAERDAASAEVVAAGKAEQRARGALDALS